MSNLSPEIMVLDKGLDLMTPSIVAPKGTLLECLNYEQVDFIGLRRIDGFQRYDGRTSPAEENIYYIAP